MKASDIAKILDKIAPPKLAYRGEELGLVVGSGNREVKVLGVTERPTVDVLQEAVDKNVDLLVIHEPLYHSEKAFLIDKSSLSFPPNRKREKLVQKGGFAIFRYHSQWDDAEEGNNETLAEILGVKVTEKIPYGRIGKISETTLGKLANDVKNKLGCAGVLVVGDKSKKVETVAVIAGSGNSLTDFMEFVKQKGVDVLISGDITDGRARFAQELGLAVIDAGDYWTENPGAKRLVNILRKKLSEIKVLHLDPGKPWVVV
ncbi:MAG: NGG1p interacting factor 3 [Candidatus Woesebacteria bacterium GW2011_GWC2_45_9]|uniref:GTP cyclohydrolase 1 type 2 homolog n=1 Tax=Candidatus Woesebacteria bacterium GW2011_GWC2_45_9 TaxID=1618589 RepID=A0A0G1N9C0_9BACT|nr:MAG: NGG1p interacting factor 3 [Candidatus Woesebacteria bacterium GW2011_GWC2_45_9]